MHESIYKIEIITRPKMLESLKKALSDIGIYGLTVSQVQGCGTQKGMTALHQCAPFSLHLLPKIKVELVTDEASMDPILETATKVLRTGKIGDGKIFVTPISKVIRIRTGETDTNALLPSSDT